MTASVDFAELAYSYCKNTDVWFDMDVDEAMEWLDAAAALEKECNELRRQVAGWKAIADDEASRLTGWLAKCTKERDELRQNLILVERNAGAERSSMKGDVERLRYMHSLANIKCAALNSELVAAQTDRAELREALQPFASWLRDIPNGDGRITSVPEGGISISDIRRARDLIARIDAHA